MMTPEAAAEAVEQHDCPSCGVPAGSPCRTGSGKVAVKYHTPRFTAVAGLRVELDVATPADRRPGEVWEAGPVPVPAPRLAEADRIVRVGYARCSTIAQGLQSQLDALAGAGCAKVFSEKISSRVKKRPEFAAARTYAEELKAIMPEARVLLTVHEMKRLGRGSAELITIADGLRAKDIGLEFLTGPLAGVHDPRGHGAAIFAFFAGMAEAEREYIREKTIEGQAAARKAGKVGGRPATIDADMAEYARTLYEKGMSANDIRLKLVITSGKRKGQHPSRASVYRALGLNGPATNEPA